MGIERVNQAIAALTAAGIRAQRGYPGGKMPSLRGPAAAVCVEKITAGETALSVTVYVPAAAGGALCEDTAWEAMQVLEAAGAVCAMEGCRFDGRAGLFSVRTEAVWETE